MHFVIQECNDICQYHAMKIVFEFADHLAQFPFLIRCHTDVIYENHTICSYFVTLRISRLDILV